MNRPVDKTFLVHAPESWRPSRRIAEQFSARGVRFEIVSNDWTALVVLDPTRKGLGAEVEKALEAADLQFHVRWNWTMRHRKLLVSGFSQGSARTSLWNGFDQAKFREYSQ